MICHLSVTLLLSKFVSYQLLKLVQRAERKLKSCWMASNVSCLLKLHIFEAGMTSRFPEVICTVSNLAKELHTCFSMEGCHNVATSPHSSKVTGLISPQLFLYGVCMFSLCLV